MEWSLGTDEQTMYLSTLTLGKLRRDVDKLDDGKRKNAINTWLERDVVARFHGRILALDQDVDLCWGKFSAEAERLGRPRPALDCLLAATAIMHDLTPVTLDERNFEHLALRTLNS